MSSQVPSIICILYLIEVTISTFPSITLLLLKQLLDDNQMILRNELLNQIPEISKQIRINDSTEFPPMIATKTS